jgi:hypothetical protein
MNVTIRVSASTPIFIKSSVTIVGRLLGKRIKLSKWFNPKKI